jgi:ion channel-forming bestrophin family protein
MNPGVRTPVKMWAVCILTFKPDSHDMIDYDPHDWNSHLLDIRGSMVREIFGRVATCVLWSAVVVIADKHLPNVELGVPATVHTLLGTAIGLLLVFRTNSSYDRFWEGRRMWGNIINETRNLGRCAAVYLKLAPDLQRKVVESTVAFAYAAKRRLRNEPGLGEADRFFSQEELQSLYTEVHLPTAVARRISETLRTARDRGVISDYVLAMIDQNSQLLVDYIGACERIQSTPLPFAYMVHLRRGLLMYCYTLPFALVTQFGWEAVPLTFLVAYIFFGIEEIGVEIEGPFGTDENDLPLERFCERIEIDVLDQIGKPAA